MELELKTIRKSLNKAYLRETVTRSDFDRSVTQLEKLLQNIDQAQKADESEEHLKNFLPPFFKKVGFDEHYINTDGRTDLAVHNGNKKKDPVGVMIETKKPGSNQMISEESPNQKAIHEAILYYLRERIEKENTDDKYIIITDLIEWFVFDAQEFDRHFIRNGPLKKEFQKWNADQKSSSNTSLMYDLIADYLDRSDTPIAGTHFSLEDYRPLIENEARTDDQELELIPLIKLLSPVHLLKQPFTNDSNSLDRQFYSELLYILGLEEQEDGSTKLIDRPDEENRIPGSLIENTISTLRYENRLTHISEPEVTYGEKKEEQLFGVALELCILWTNRILFLKLLEAQLYRYHREDQHFKFLNYEMVDEFDELNKLFFRVLAIKEEERHPSDLDKFGHIPYLNSSLFDVSSLEDKTTRISGLDDKVTMPVYSRTVLKDQQGKSLKGEELNTLKYLFRFLEAYNFSAEGKEEIQEENKSLINASVLGLIFEKINGYKDGSFYTPGFITEYMCRETLRKSVLDKFNRLYSWECSEFGDLYNKISREDITLPEANEVVNSITVCDPAVGSGHFLVSALNELIAIKSDLGILCDENYKVFRNTDVHVEHDELVVTYGDDELFEYNLKGVWSNDSIDRSVNSETQRLQKALFEEKRRLIENSLFGVDINPNSVKICRLRLWIELLKHAYYTGDSDYQKLEVLPNIDINIKQGNSLVSRFDLDVDLEQILDETEYTLDDYKQAVADYKETRDQDTKRELRTLINEMKEAFTVELEELHPERKKLKKLKAQLIREETQQDMFGDDDEHSGSQEAEIEKLEKKVAKQKEVVDDLEAATFYRQAFEWRFEFPEVLDDDGAFTGFEVVIGNPPYVRQESLKELKDYLKDNFEVYYGTADLYQYFIERGMGLLKDRGLFHYIVSNKWMRANYGKPLREWLQQYQIESIIDFGDLPVFEEATTYPCLLQLQNSELETVFVAAEIEDLDFEDLNKRLGDTNFDVDQTKLLNEGWTLINTKAQNLLQKIKKQGDSLKKNVDGRIHYGIKTGLNKAFVIDGETREKLISDDSKSEELIKPFLGGRDIKRFQVPDPKKFVILIPNGWTDQQTEKDNKWEWFSNEYSAISDYLYQFKEKAKARYDQGQYWWELRACDYYDAFETPKIMYQVFQVTPCFTYDYTKALCNNSVWIISDANKSLLAILNSKLGWFLISSFCTEIRNGYQLIFKYLGQIPIREGSKGQQEKIESLVDQILTAKEDDPEADTSELESEIDELVYELYGLSEEEIAIVEESVG